MSICNIYLFPVLVLRAGFAPVPVHYFFITFSYFPFWFQGQGCGFDCACSCVLRVFIITQIVMENSQKQGITLIQSSKMHYFGSSDAESRHEFTYEPRREKTGLLHMRKQRRKSASR